MTHTQQIRLYERPSYYIPRIAAVHDICGYGKCSLTVAIPVLSAAGIDVCPIPTAVFSSHTKYPHFSFLDTTDGLPAFLKAWEQIGVELDGIYSGFLGSKDQVRLIEQLYATYPKALRIVDPVMGDGGKIYPTYTPELCQAMGRLCHQADLLTPNLTEAALLSGRSYQGQAPSDAEVKALLKALVATGAKYVVLKGIERGEQIFNYIAGVECETLALGAELLPFNLHGTGDLYCSSLTAALYAGRDLAFAVNFAGQIVRKAMLSSQHQPNFKERGVSFERELGQITALLG